MCNQIEMLATIDECRWVGQCDHGTYHVTWANMTIHWHPSDFEEVVIFLKNAHFLTFLGTETSHYANACGLYISDNGDCQLWMKGFGIYLTRPSFTQFYDMLISASSPVIETLFNDLTDWLNDSR